MRSVAVLGATGALGKATVDELIARNISVKILVRDIEEYKALYPQQKFPGRINVVQGDLDTNQSIATVMENVDAVFPCYNTNLGNWETDMINWTDKIAKLASALEARIIYPGCILNYGIKDKPINEEEHQDAISEIGQLKIAIERRLYRAAQEGARLTIIRLPNIYGPADFKSMISGIFKAAVKNKMCIWDGNINIKHDFLYSKDAAKALVEASLSEKAMDKVFHFNGNKIVVKDWISEIYKLAGADISKQYYAPSVIQNKIKAIISKERKLKNQLRYFTEHEIFFDGSLYRKEIANFQLSLLENSIIETLEWYKYWFQNQS